jgi:hypothetical protein
MYNLKRYHKNYCNKTPVIKKLIYIVITFVIIIAVPLALIVLDAMEVITNKSEDN